MTVTWNRIEVVNDSPSTRKGLAATLADPLWQLARQWQLGELTAEDAATPVAVSVESTSFPIDRLRIGHHERRLDGGTPIEALVEAEPASVPDLRSRIRGGHHLHSLIARTNAAVAASVRDAFRFFEQIDARDSALVAAVASRSLDAWAAFDAIRTDGAAAVAQRVASAQVAMLVPILDAWAAWFAARSGYEAPSAWNAQRACYEFALVASVEDRDVVLAADRYRGGRLDWSDLEGTAQPFSGHVTPRSHAETLLPTPIEFAGAPSPRFFELEDHTVRFTTIAGNAPDVATSLLVEVALVYGNDWFVVPVSAPVCALHKIERVVVTDSFGTKTMHASRLRSNKWRVFETGANGIDDYLVVLPTIGVPLDGPAIEEVAIARDEAANLAWAIERSVSDGLGLAVRRDAVDPVPHASSDLPRYVPMREPRSTWFPLVARGRQLVGAGIRGIARTESPLGQILAGWPDVQFAGSSVAREGIVVQRRWQYAPTRDNEYRLWTTRSVRSNAADVSGGVAFDQLVPPTST